MKKGTKITIPRKFDETSKVIAQLFGVSDRYVRMVINNAINLKSKAAKQKAIKIKEAYSQYRYEKNLLVKRIEELIEVKVA